MGKTLIDLDFRKKYGVNIIAIKGPENAINVSPLPGDVIADGDVLVVMGKRKASAGSSSAAKSSVGIPPEAAFIPEFRTGFGQSRSRSARSGAVFGPYQ